MVVKNLPTGPGILFIPENFKLIEKYNKKLIPLPTFHYIWNHLFKPCLSCSLSMLWLIGAGARVNPFLFFFFLNLDLRKQTKNKKNQKRHVKKQI